jgi:hypothetical protein
MNDHSGHEGLLLLIGELIYKNQLLREAIASKDEALTLFHIRFLRAAASGCSCGVGSQPSFVQDMVRLREAEFPNCRGWSFNEFGEAILYQPRSLTNTHTSRENAPVEK